jgi:hypothetical protein
MFPPSRQVVVYGQSVGSGPSCFLASREHVAGLVLHSGLTSGLRVLTPSRALGCFDIFPNVDRIQRVTCPVLVIHGEKDVEVPCEHGCVYCPLSYHCDTKLCSLWRGLVRRGAEGIGVCGGWRGQEELV